MALLRQGGGSLTEAEHWELQERVFVAALDLGERDAAARVLSAITSKFGFQVRASSVEPTRASR
jgi:hypothetical protein